MSILSFFESRRRGACPRSPFRVFVVGLGAIGFLTGAAKGQVPAVENGAAASPAETAGPDTTDQAAEIYRERFRPQFHFTPERNWMNDPNGMVHHDGEYHLFYQYNPFGDRWGHMSWGHAVSPDLVHWEHLPVAIPEADGVMIFSGSAVVDHANTSGLGRDGRAPLVAIYTGHHTGRPLQDQRIAFSNDRGRRWTNLPENPVIDIGAADFRDPKVFRHEATDRWIMVVALPVERKVRFYASQDLKKWDVTGEFGPAGSVAGIWECPDLFPLPVEGSDNASRWVLVVNVGSGAPAGGSGCQYFVGDFDGATFSLHAPSLPGATLESVPEGRLFEDFEDGYGEWSVEGEAFGSAPAVGTLDGQQEVGGFRGRALVNTYLGGDGATGTLTSPEFEIRDRFISFLAGGGNHAGRTCVELVIDGETAFSTTGDAAERLAWKSWDVSALRGRTARIRIVDDHDGGWGHINVDHILFADTPARPAGEGGAWADHGKDFYAAVSWSDVPPEDGRRIWLGWMSNWEYAGDVPTSPWRGAMTVPRTLTLRQVGDSFRLVQAPVRELERLRGEPMVASDLTIPQASEWMKRLAELPGGLELALDLERLRPGDRVELSLSTTGESGQALLVLEVGEDGGEGVLSLDRGSYGTTAFHSRFPGRHSAPLRVVDGVVSIRLLVDMSSVEIFAGGGETVLSELVFPEPGAPRLSLAADGAGVVVRRIAAFPIRSIWHP